MIVNKKWIVGISVVLVLVVILGVLLGVLLPRHNNVNNGNVDSYFEELPETSKWYGDEEIRILRQYLSFPTMPPDIDYVPTVEFLKQQAASLDLPLSMYYPVNEANPVVVMTWAGSDPSLKSILLNSHTDVVPIFEEFWTHRPFAADIDEEGRIFARGAQDTKSTGMLYLAAIRALKKEGIQQLKRTFHISFVPDEEMGGFNGMDSFAKSAEFAGLNVGYALDECSVSPTNVLTVINDERSTWRMEFTCHGVTGHGSILFENTTGEKIAHLISRFMERRQVEMDNMRNSNATTYANVTSINLTMLKGGVQGNVIPPELSVTFDVRLAVNADHDQFQRDIDQWIEEAGGDITINYLIHDPKVPKTSVDETNPLWTVLESTARELGLEIVPGVSTGATDMRFLRRQNIPAFGFNTMMNTPRLLHDHDEFVYADVYLTSIDTYKRVISNLGDI
ncbi:aminoacylase-1A-like [Bradysia coprophila]|uniref:aminoacylase-1A-like n=1 Tax=Bradysia coprophila TaxID=38358 RepID=UPI00187DBE6F|nr:aminoacylase-1A-like [Bradysia coprophila]